MPVLVEHYGGVWRLSKRNYRRFLNKIASGEDWVVDDFGTYLGNIDSNVTDMKPEMAWEKLEGL